MAGLPGLVAAVIAMLAAGACFWLAYIGWRLLLRRGPLLDRAAGFLCLSIGSVLASACTWAAALVLGTFEP